MKKIIKRLVDRFNDKYIIVKDFEKDEYYLLIEYRADYSNHRKDEYKIGYKVEVKGLKNINIFIVNNGLEFVEDKCYDKDKEVKHGKNR